MHDYFQVSRTHGASPRDKTCESPTRVTVKLLLFNTSKIDSTKKAIFIVPAEVLESCVCHGGGGDHIYIYIYICLCTPSFTYFQWASTIIVMLLLVIIVVSPIICYNLRCVGSIVLCSGRLCVCVCAIPSAVGSTTVADARSSSHPYVASASPLLVVVCLLVFVSGVRLLPLLLFLLLCCLLLLEQLLHVFCPGSLTESIQIKPAFSLLL